MSGPTSNEPSIALDENISPIRVESLFAWADQSMRDLPEERVCVVKWWRRAPPGMPGWSLVSELPGLKHAQPQHYTGQPPQEPHSGARGREAACLPVGRLWAQSFRSQQSQGAHSGTHGRESVCLSLGGLWVQGFNIQGPQGPHSDAHGRKAVCLPLG